LNVVQHSGFMGAHNIGFMDLQVKLGRLMGKFLDIKVPGFF